MAPSQIVGWMSTMTLTAISYVYRIIVLIPLCDQEFIILESTSKIMNSWCDRLSLNFMAIGQLVGIVCNTCSQLWIAWLSRTMASTAICVTRRHEKIGLIAMCTEYTCTFALFHYLTFCVSYTNSVNCIKFIIVCSISLSLCAVLVYHCVLYQFIIVCCVSFNSFIDKLASYMFRLQLMKLQSPKSDQISCEH